jgi:hypothetical protein
MRAGGESDEDIEMQIAQFVRLKAVIGTNVG